MAVTKRSFRGQVERRQIEVSDPGDRPTPDIGEVDVSTVPDDQGLDRDSIDILLGGARGVAMSAAARGATSPYGAGYSGRQEDANPDSTGHAGPFPEVASGDIVPRSTGAGQGQKMVRRQSGQPGATPPELFGGSRTNQGKNTG